MSYARRIFYNPLFEFLMWMLVIGLLIGAGLQGCATSQAVDDPSATWNVGLDIERVEGCGTFEADMPVTIGGFTIVVPLNLAFCTYASPDPSGGDKLINCVVIEQSLAGTGLVAGTPSKEVCVQAGFTPFRPGLPVPIPADAERASFQPGGLDAGGGDSHEGGADDSGGGAAPSAGAVTTETAMPEPVTATGAAPD